MKKGIWLAFIMAILGIDILLSTGDIYAAEKKETIPGKTYDLGEKDAYDLSKITTESGSASRMYIEGDISEVTDQNGFVSYAVNSGNLKVKLDEKYGLELFNPTAAQNWHIVTDKNKKVDNVTLSESIGSGAIVVQTSKDGKIWITSETETDLYNKLDKINQRTINGEDVDAFYETTNVQITNGCYYRILVAYRLQKENDPSKVLFVPVKNTEEKEQIEKYEFYAFDPNVDHEEKLDVETSYEFGDVYRVDSPDGFGSPRRIESDDPHIDWYVGKFYVSGWTDVRKDEIDPDTSMEIPTFLKVPGDRAALWFNLEQDINRCNGRNDVKIDYLSSGSDVYFGTPTIENFGRGALIIRKTDKQGKKERQIYTNYLEASATVGANTRVDLFEEGDYEVALDYQLHYDKPFVFKTKTTKTLPYRVFFKFKVRNGDISAFMRDVDTGQFITNANIAEHGFVIDLANSQYLQTKIKREILTDSMDGLIEDTKFSGVAKEGREYTDEGKYTVTVKNLATDDVVEKTIYVGNSDIMRAHMATGKPIEEIKAEIDAGATIDENGRIIEPEPEIEEDVESEMMEKDPAHPTEEVASLDNNDKVSGHSDGKTISQNNGEEKTAKPSISIVAVVSILAVILLGATGILVKKRKPERKEEEDNKE